MTIDPRLTLALVFAMVVESGAGFLWAGRVMARLDDAERRIALVEPAGERLARIEERVADLQAGLTRIENKLPERDR